jgi:hypothetical protein
MHNRPTPTPDPPLKGEGEKRVEAQTLPPCGGGRPGVGGSGGRAGSVPAIEVLEDVLTPPAGARSAQGVGPGAPLCRSRRPGGHRQSGVRRAARPRPLCPPDGQRHPARPRPGGARLGVAGRSRHHRCLVRGAHGPGPLGEAERARLEAPPPAGLPAWVQGNYPEWLAGSFERAFGERAMAEGAGLSRRAPGRLARQHA